MLEAAEDESELAGVIAHEMAHDAARHANNLMKRATIAGIFYQAAQITAMILTAALRALVLTTHLQYGFCGLGSVLNLELLGVSRDSNLRLTSWACNMPGTPVMIQAVSSGSLTK